MLQGESSTRLFGVTPRNVIADHLMRLAALCRLASQSYASTAARAWRADLESRNKSKLADTVADPADSPELFEEGWDAALAKEQARGEYVADEAVPNAAPANQNGEEDEQEAKEEEEDSTEETPA